MTENEQKIINKISDLSGDYKCYDNRINHEESLVLDRLLSENQQYRAIGTVEECEKAMDFELAKQDKMLAEVIDDYLKYIKIGTIEEFKALKEKNTPKKVAYQVEHEKCPTCGSFHVFGKHCTECGQAVDYD